MEEQFYLGLPFVIAAVAWWARLKGLRWRPLLAWLLILGLLASFALSLLLSYGHPLPAVSQPESAAFYSAPTRAWQFIAGVLLALVAASRNGLPAAVRHSATGVIGAALVGLGYAIVHADHAFPGIGAAIPTLGATAVIAGGHRLPGFSSRLLTWIGDLSYSWYLWHWPFIVISKLVAPGKFTAVIAAALSLGIAWIAYHTVEEPIRRRPVDQRRQLARLVLACALPPLLAAGLLVSGSRAHWWDAEITDMARQVGPVPVGRDVGCHGFTPLADRPPACTFGTGHDRLILLGDSNGAQLAEATVGAAGDLRMRATLGTAPGCPMVDVEMPSSGSGDAACRTYVRETLEWLATQPPSTVLIANASENIEMPQVVMSGPSGRHVSAPSGKEEVWRDGLVRVIRAVRGAGHRPVLVATIPHFGNPRTNSWWNPSQCTMITLAEDVTRCGEVMRLSQSDRDQQRALRAERAAAAETDVPYIDLRASVCPGGVCRTNHGTEWIYRDGLHLSTRFSGQLSGTLAEEITRAGQHD